MWVSNVNIFTGKLSFIVTGGMLMSVVGIVKNIIVGAGKYGISHLKCSR